LPDWRLRLAACCWRVVWSSPCSPPFGRSRHYSCRTDDRCYREAFTSSRRWRNDPSDDDLAYGRARPAPAHAGKRGDRTRPPPRPPLGFPRTTPRWCFSSTSPALCSRTTSNRRDSMPRSPH
jgi:hypothetical protein